MTLMLAFKRSVSSDLLYTCTQLDCVSYLTSWCWLAFPKYFGLVNVCILALKAFLLLALTAADCSPQCQVLALFFYFFQLVSKNERNKKNLQIEKKNKNNSVQFFLSKGAGNCIFRCDFLHTWTLLSFFVSFQQWHTSTAHGDGHVALRVGMATPDTRAGTA